VLNEVVISSVSASNMISIVGIVRNYFQEVGSWRLSFVCKTALLNGGFYGRTVV
jgi:hypothetical protein